MNTVTLRAFRDELQKIAGDFGGTGRFLTKTLNKGVSAAPQAAAAVRKPMPSGSDMLAKIRAMKSGGAPTTIRA